jgi:aspartyl-tRNA(Asn)/glutamyl-tRNA(Gln) amidotransferase subunit A
MIGTPSIEHEGLSRSDRVTHGLQQDEARPGRRHPNGIHDVTDHQVSQRVRASLERIERLDHTLGAFVHVDRDRALRRAGAIDRRGAEDQRSVPLRGDTVGVKDVIDVAGLPTTAGTAAIPAWIPSRTASAVVRLERAGGVVVGKTATAEWAIGGAGADRPNGLPRNPWDAARSPGDSSNGSAVAVSARLCSIALGTDTAGSIRVPASFTGIAGLKPTRGAIPRTNIVALSPTLDTVGPLAVHVEDLERVLVALRLPTFGRPAARKVRVGIDERYLLRAGHSDPAVLGRVNEAIDVLADGGARRVDVELSGLVDATPVYHAILLAEAARTHDPQRRDRAGYGVAARQLLEQGDAISAREVRAARRQRLRLIAQFRRAFEVADLLVSPTTPRVAPLLDAAGFEHPAGRLPSDDVFTFPANLVGIPALSMPVGSLDGLPVGFQLQGPWGSDRWLVEIGRRLEQRVGVLPPPPWPMP